MTPSDLPPRRPSATTRRSLLAIGLGSLVALALPRARSSRRSRVARTFPTMGTTATVTVLDGDTSRANAAIDAAVAEILRVERLLTRFDPASEIGRVNRTAALAPVSVGEDAARVVTEGLRWAEATDGAFDPCLERAIDVWDVLERRVPPEAALVRRYAGRRLHRHVDVARSGGGSVVSFDDPDVGLDLGGIGKGYAADRAAAVLRSLGVRDAIVAVAGDLVAMGRGETGDPWRIGIRDPDDASALAGEVLVSDAAVSTSGDYERFFEFEGRRYHHILDPATASPRTTAMRSVTVVAATCMTADAAATSCFGRDPVDANRWLSRRGGDARIAHVVA